jgi:hypothetical protein
LIVLGDVAFDGGLQLDDAGEGTAPEPPPARGREEAVDRIEPGRGGRGEVKGRRVPSAERQAGRVRPRACIWPSLVDGQHHGMGSGAM